MDVVGSEIGHKMRSAIKAKLTELGCYVDDELPDYVMVMVANKRTRSQMEDDLQLFLGDNTELFVNWLHQVLKKLQEVTVATPLKAVDTEKVKERSLSKERKLKDKKEKSKKSDGSKKSKKKAKDKTHKKKDEKKKNKKKSKHEPIRPNVPPLLMNIEKDSEPSITDVFAGQILKNHGIILDTRQDEVKIVEKKPIVAEVKRPVIPIIDPATIPSQTTTTSETEELNNTHNNESNKTVTDIDSVITSETSETIVTTETSETVCVSKPTETIVEITEDLEREEKIKEMNEIEAKILGLKEKLANQLENQNDSMSDDEDFLNIRTEADELINDFAEEVFQEISQPTPVVTPPLRSRKSPSPSPPLPAKKAVSKDIPETLPQIELNLPKRPIRERLGAPIQKKDAVTEKDKVKPSEKAAKSPERFTPEREPEIRTQKSAKSRLSSLPERTEPQRKKPTSDDSTKSDNSSKRLTSRVSVLERCGSRVTCASVVRVRPRPRGPAPASSLLLRAVADAHKSLLSIPPKVETSHKTVKRALVRPMRRSVDPKKIVIEVPCADININSTDSISDNVSLGDLESDGGDSPKARRDILDKEEYTPMAITKVIKNKEYVPSRTLIRHDDKLLVETINIHNTTADKDKDTQFIVTMDGYHPNSFLAKKLMTEGLLNDEDEITKPDDSVKTDTSKTEPIGNLGNNNNKGTKDIVKDKIESEPTESIISSRAQSSTEVRSKSSEGKNESIRPPEKEVINSAKEDSSPEKRKSNVSAPLPSVEKRKSDIFVEASTTRKRKCNVSVDPENLKTEVWIETPIIEAASDITLEKPVQRSDISVDRPVLEKRKSDVSLESTLENDEKKSPPVKKRKASPIIFDVHKKEKAVAAVRERKISANSDSNFVLTSSSNAHKYDTVPPLSPVNKAAWCRAFPLCRYGAACAFAHPRCKFAAACTRRACPYSHASDTVPPAGPALASHVVPAANYKSISAGAFANLCKFYPSCSNPSCHYYHPKPCRFGKACTNKLECNFYHHDVPAGKW